MPFSGIGTTCSNCSRDSGVAMRPAVIGVAMMPGAAAFNGMPAPAHAAVAASRRTHRESASLAEA